MLAFIINRVSGMFLPLNVTSYGFFFIRTFLPVKQPHSHQIELHFASYACKPLPSQFYAYMDGFQQAGLESPLASLYITSGTKRPFRRISMHHPAGTGIEILPNSQIRARNVSFRPHSRTSISNYAAG